MNGERTRKKKRKTETEKKTEMKHPKYAAVQNLGPERHLELNPRVASRIRIFEELIRANNANNGAVHPGGHGGAPAKKQRWRQPAGQSTRPPLAPTFSSSSSTSSSSSAGSPRLQRAPRATAAAAAKPVTSTSSTSASTFRAVKTSSSAATETTGARLPLWRRRCSQHLLDGSNLSLAGSSSSGYLSSATPEPAESGTPPTRADAGCDAEERQIEREIFSRFSTDDDDDEDEDEIQWSDLDGRAAADSDPTLSADVEVLTPPYPSSFHLFSDWIEIYLLSGHSVVSCLLFLRTRFHCTRKILLPKMCRLLRGSMRLVVVVVGGGMGAIGATTLGQFCEQIQKCEPNGTKWGRVSGKCQRNVERKRRVSLLSAGNGGRHSHAANFSGLPSSSDSRRWRNYYLRGKRLPNNSRIDHRFPSSSSPQILLHSTYFFYFMNPAPIFPSVFIVFICSATKAVNECDLIAISFFRATLACRWARFSGTPRTGWYCVPNRIIIQLFLDIFPRRSAVTSGGSAGRASRQPSRSFPSAMPRLLGPQTAGQTQSTFLDLISNQILSYHVNDIHTIPFFSSDCECFFYGRLFFPSFSSSQCNILVHPFRVKTKRDSADGLGFELTQVQDTAIRCIQRNVRKLQAVRAWPWWRLMLRLSPLLNVHRTEEELKSRTV